MARAISAGYCVHQRADIEQGYRSERDDDGTAPGYFPGLMSNHPDLVEV
jgi:hypothetical protein